MYKAIKGYECFYEINELGKIRSVDRKVKSKNGKTIHYKGKELKLKMNKDEYQNVNLNKNGISKTWRVPRLVAETFLPNPDNLPEIHHKNHDRGDNRVENLAWVTRSEQMDEHLRAAKGTKLRVVGHGIDKIFISAKAVQRELGIADRYVMQVAKGKYKQAKGYRIYFAD